MTPKVCIGNDVFGYQVHCSPLFLIKEVTVTSKACKPEITTGKSDSHLSALKEVRDQIIEFNRAAKVDGLGMFSPSIDPDGNPAISYRPDPALSNSLNLPGVFTGTILNRENIGKTKRRIGCQVE